MEFPTFAIQFYCEHSVEQSFGRLEFLDTLGDVSIGFSAPLRSRHPSPPSFKVLHRVVRI